MKMGEGEYLFANGEKYSGGFSNDLREGKGSYSWRLGDTLTGWWRSDEING